MATAPDRVPADDLPGTAGVPRAAGGAVPADDLPSTSGERPGFLAGLKQGEKDSLVVASLRAMLRGDERPDPSKLHAVPGGTFDTPTGLPNTPGPSQAAPMSSAQIRQAFKDTMSAIKANPGAAAGYLTGSVVSPDLLIPVGGEARLATLPKSLRGLAKVGRSAARGGVLAGAQSAADQTADTGTVSGQQVLHSVELGAGLSALARTASGVAGVPRALARSAQEPRSAGYAAQVKELTDIGVPLRPAQTGGTPAAQKTETLVSSMGGRARQEGIVHDQARAVNRWVNEQMGLTGDKASGDAVVKQKGKLGADLGNIYGRGKVPPLTVSQVQAHVAAGLDPYGIRAGIPEGEGELADRFRSAVESGASGAEYKRLRADLRSRAQSLQSGPGSNPEQALWYWGARRVLDDQFVPGTHADALQLPLLRSQYSAAKTALDARKSGGLTPDGDYDLAELGEAARKANTNWNELPEARQSEFIRKGAAAEATGTRPPNAGFAPRQREAPESPVGVHGVAHRAGTVMGGGAAATIAGLAATGHPGLAAGAAALALAARTAAPRIWYGGQPAPMIGRVAPWIPPKLAAMETSDEP